MPDALPYQSSDSQSRTPRRAWILLVLAWIVLLAPAYLSQLGAGTTVNVRNLFEAIRGFALTLHLPPAIAVRLALYLPFIFQTAVIVLLALLARRAVRDRRTSAARIVRISAVGVILCACFPLVAITYVAFFLA